eukprot:scaffold225285_cov20-Prasinocladus_malaysianus.AAC.2
MFSPVRLLGGLSMAASDSCCVLLLVVLVLQKPLAVLHFGSPALAVQVEHSPQAVSSHYASCSLT